MIQTNYKILSVIEMDDYLKANGKTEGIWSYDLQLKTNLCFVYYLNSGEVALIPSNMSETSKGILFSERKFFDECVRNDSFPIENERKGMEEHYQVEIKTVNTQIKNIFEALSSKLSPKEPLDGNNMASLSKLLELTKKKWKRLTPQEQIYAGLLLGEYIRRSYNGKWLLLKKYGIYNPYYEVGILYPDNSILELRNYLNAYYDQPVTPEMFVTFIAETNIPLSAIDSSLYKILE